MLTATAVVAEWGAYFIDEGQSVSDLKTLFKEASETEDIFAQGVTTNNTTVRKSQVVTTRVLQPFQKAFTQLGGTTFTPKDIPLYRLKIDIQESVDDLHDSWLAYLTSNSLDRKTWPIVRWLAEIYGITQHKHDREMNEVFLGEYAAPTPGTAGAISTSMDGIRKKIRDLHTLGTSIVFATGTIPTDPATFCTYIENAVAAIPELIKALGGTINMNRTLRNRYRAGKRAKYNAAYDQMKGESDTIMDWEQFSVKGLPSMTGSNMIWYTPDINKNRFYIASENQSIFQIESVDRTVKMFTDYYFGLGFWIDQYVFHNDQDLGS
ncbi:MAG: hypothetical protein JWO03_928 [Bacteroidetes bacterium]|nr:hypothetical protein [Bacteroidota bacterium]